MFGDIQFTYNFVEPQLAFCFHPHKAQPRPAWPRSLKRSDDHAETGDVPGAENTLWHPLHASTSLEVAESRTLSASPEERQLQFLVVGGHRHLGAEAPNAGTQGSRQGVTRPAAPGGAAGLFIPLTPMPPHCLGAYLGSIGRIQLKHRKYRSKSNTSATSVRLYRAMTQFAFLLPIGRRQGPRDRDGQSSLGHGYARQMGGTAPRYNPHVQ
jgi:hypothetical protein